MASRVALALLACWAWHWSRGPCSSQSPEGLAFARVARPGRNTKSIRPRRRSASLLADLEEEEQQTRSQPKRRPVKSVKKSLRVPLKGGCCKYRVQRHWRWQQMLEEPLGVYACCNDTGPPRYHALFVSEPGMQEFLGCFPTPKMAAEAFDWRAREASWRVVNYPISADEDDAKTLLQDKFTIYRARGFPYPPQDETWREEQLHELLRANATALWTSPNTLRLPDLEYGEGLQLCWSFHPHSYDVSKTQSLRKDGALKKKPSALGTFRSDAGLIKSLRTCIERGGDPDCSPVTLRAECKFHDDSLVFKGGGSWIANFAPTVAAALYERFGGKGGTVYDPSAGWGGRMLGARLAGVRKYISCEPSTKTFEGLEELASFAAGDLEVDLRCCGSELFVPDDTVDLVFTSPPYFNTELYSKEATQSHVKFPTAQTWRLGFLEPTLRNAAAALRPGGYFLLALTARRTHRRAGLDLEADVQEIAAALGLQQAMGACCSSAKRAGHGLEAFPSKADAMEAEADLQESDDDDQKVHLFVEVTSTCCPAAKRDEQGLEAAEEPIGAFTARASKVELQEKLRIYEERAKQQPQDAGAHWSLGGLRLALGNFAAAERAYAEAARLEPGDEFARFGLGQAREKQGKLAAAAEAYAAAQHLGYDGGEALNRVSKELEKEAAEAVKCPVKAP